VRDAGRTRQPAGIGSAGRGVSLDSTAHRGPRAHPIAGIVALDESASPLRLDFLALFLVGIVGLKLWSKRRTAQPKCSGTYALVLGNLRRRWDYTVSRWSANPLG
jgi:hypothetical protein